MKYRGLILDRFQEQAIQALDAGHSVLVAAPTGTGKTIIADWIVEEALNTGREVVYTAPIKALSNQKFRDYVRLYGEDRVGLVTGDLVIRRDAPCRVMTTEVLRNMLLSGEQLPHLKAVILDEIHFLDDRDRGTVWEEVLIYLPRTVQIVGLSATLSNLSDFAEWLESVRGQRVVTVTEDRRAVPLHIHYASVDTGLVEPPDYARIWKRKRHQVAEPAGRGRRGRDRGRGGSRGRPARRTTHVDLHNMAWEREYAPYLYFVFSRRDTEVCARRLGEEVGCLLDEAQQAAVAEHLNARAGELGAALDPSLRALYLKGIAFHHAGLHVKLKTLVEELYEAKLVQVLYCTSTFALGINMPARAVIFDGLKKYDGRGFAPLTTRQFMQKAGRAGRRGLDDEGHVILRIDVGEYEEVLPQLERYAKNRVEPIRSTFNLSWNSVVNLLARHPPERCREIVEKSFLNWWLERQAERLAATDAVGKQERRLQRRAARDRGRCWAEFEVKVNYLKLIGYLGDDGFNAGATALKSLQMSEILLTELLLEGIFEGLAPSLLFGLLCALTQDLPRHARPNFRPRPDERALAQAVARIRFAPIVADAEELTGEQYPWCPDLIHLGRAWADGRPLQELMLAIHSDTDISGDLITGFRRAKDLAGQLRDALADDPAQVDKLTRLIRSVSRDEVEVVG